MSDKTRLMAIADRLADCFRADASDLEWAVSKGWMQEGIIEQGQLSDCEMSEGDFEIGEPFFEFTQSGLAILSGAETQSNTNKGE